jgi:hypothetical protein
MKNSVGKCFYDLTTTHRSNVLLTQKINSGGRIAEFVRSRLYLACQHHCSYGREQLVIDQNGREGRELRVFDEKL